MIINSQMDNDPVCMVCLNPICEINNGWKCTVCNRIIAHNICIQEWFSRKKTCPQCFTKVIEKNHHISGIERLRKIAPACSVLSMISIGMMNFKKLFVMGIVIFDLIILVCIFVYFDCYKKMKSRCVNMTTPLSQTEIEPEPINSVV